MPTTRTQGRVSTPKRASTARRIAAVIQTVSPIPKPNLGGSCSPLGLQGEGPAEGGVQDAGEPGNQVATGASQAARAGDPAPVATPTSVERARWPHEHIGRAAPIDQQQKLGLRPRTCISFAAKESALLGGK